MKQFILKLLGWLVFAGIVVGGLEIGLRAAPGMIPLTLLKRFHSDTRAEIAERRSLWGMAQMITIDRDDGGPALQIFKPNSKLWFDFNAEGEKGFTLMDENGFCNPERDTYDLPQIDIIAIGDSFTWCIAFDPQSSWISQIGEITGLSVYNLGRGGIGPYDYLQMLKHFGLAKKPRYVVMNIYEGNDIRDAKRYQDHVQAGKAGKTLYASASDRGERDLDLEKLLDYPLLRNSYAINTIMAMSDKAYEGARNVVLRMTGGEVPLKVDFHYSLHFPEKTVPFNIQNADESEVRHALKLKAGEIDFSPFDAALENFARLAAEHHFTPVLSYAPSAYTAYADYVAFDDPALSELMPWFSHSQQDYLRSKARELGFVFVDLVPALQTAARKLQDRELLYNPANVHWTVKGNRVVAAAIARAIQNPESAVTTDGAGTLHPN
jgi:hypothetical protein